MVHGVHPNCSDGRGSEKSTGINSSYRQCPLGPLRQRVPRQCLGDLLVVVLDVQNALDAAFVAGVAVAGEDIPCRK